MPEVGDGALALLQTRPAVLRQRPGHPHQRAEHGCRPSWTWSSTTTTSSTAPTCNRAWPTCSSTFRPRCTWSSAPASTRRCRWPACAPGASWSRSVPPTCASPWPRSRPTSTTSPRSSSPRRHRGAGDAHRRVGRRPPAGGALTAGAGRARARSSLPSPATTATSWTTWSRRCSSRQPPQVRDFLLQTCILDRLSGPLCDGRHRQHRQPGHARAPGPRQPVPRPPGRHPPLVPLPPPVRRGAAAPTCSTGAAEEVADLHRRASRWYDEAGEPAAAVRHAGRCRRHRPGSRPRRARRPCAAAGPAGGDHRRLARAHPRRGGAGTARAGPRFHRGTDVQRPVHRRRGTPATTSSSASRQPRPDGQAGRTATGNGRRRPRRVEPATRGTRAVPLRAVAHRRRHGRRPSPTPTSPSPAPPRTTT